MTLDELFKLKQFRLGKVGVMTEGVWMPAEAGVENHDWIKQDINTESYHGLDPTWICKICGITVSASFTLFKPESDVVCLIHSEVVSCTDVMMNRACK